MKKKIKVNFMSEIGAKGGSVTSEAKAVAVRINGCAPVRPGSRPRGRPRKIVCIYCQDREPSRGGMLCEPCRVKIDKHAKKNALKFNIKKAAK